jgi:tetratricopeptide (TPR) repeat protein
MAKAFVRSMTQDLFTAGREAKRGKKDLELYLDHDPDDPTAKGLLGGFLYFADTIPSAYKFFSKLLFLPSGDRELGLEYLRAAVRRGGLLENDLKLILYNVYFYFEGRYEEGLAGLQEMNELYPEYARTAIPLAVSRPYVPQLSEMNDKLVEETVNSIYRAPHRDVNWSSLYVVQVFRAYGDRFCNHSSTTQARLRGIIHEAPRHPDWVEPFARLELGRLYASLGRRDDASALFESVADSDTFGFLKDEAKTLLKDLSKYADYFDAPPPPDMDDWIAALYVADRDSLGGLRSRFDAHAASSIAAAFYVGECDLLSGRYERALKSYYRVVSADAPAWNHTYQLIASTRIAEVFAQRGQYEEASKHQAYAMKFYHREYLIDWVVEGRQRYFERLAKGEETVPPTLLSVNP